MSSVRCGCSRRLIPTRLLALLLLPLLWLICSNTSVGLRRVPIQDPYYGLLKDSSEPSSFAIATFLDDSFTESDSTDEDFYFIGARILAYQTLHSNTTRSRTPTPFIVLASPRVSQQKRDRLQRDGATLIEAHPIPLPWWVSTSQKRWSNQFDKLRLLQLTQFQRVVFIDADTILTRPVDAIFHDPAVRPAADTLTPLERPGAVRGDEAQLPAQYVFAARPNNEYAGKRDHGFPPDSHDSLSAGFWVAAPSAELFGYLMSILTHPFRFLPQNMEQSLLNYAFRRDGSMPWKELAPEWSATWPNDADVDAGVVTLHEKFWLGRGPQALQERWWSERAAMEAYFSGKDTGAEATQNVIIPVKY
jgi:alpha-N-acetylglucosamine transferase